ncbi:MAG: hypothetical protein IT461_07665 [Planctomycetes bacterium]|nr:hypothetical protein [Planctomycetota bacterium]
MTHDPYKDLAIADRNLNIGFWSWLLMLALAAPLCAQTPPTSIPTPQASESKESFVLEPTGLATGAQNATLRLISNTPAGFASSSSRQPEIKFGEGVKLVTGSFKMLNANEAECKVNVDADAMGVSDVSLIFYSVNGTKVLSTQRATLGLLGPAKVGAIDVSVESSPVVRVNVTDAQNAGVIVLSGNLSGAVTLSAPTGTRFSRAPSPVTSKGTIGSPALAENNTQFNFIINSGQADTVVRVTEISYDTSLFTTTGGVLGALNCAISGAALGGQSTLVANAHTALTTIAGSNDNTDAPADTSNQGSNSSSSGETTSSGTSQNNPSSGTGASRTRETERPSRNDSGNSNRNSGGRSVNSPAQPGGGSAPRESSAPPPGPANPGVQPAPGGRAEPPRGPSPGAAPAPAGGSQPRSGGDGSATVGTTKEGEEKPPAKVEEPKVVLITTPGIYFCDKDFKPLDILVLNALVSEKAGARVWISVKLKADKTPEVDTISVTLRVCGVSRTLKLTETGKTTGEFRCDSSGVLLVSEENPDSATTEEKAAEVKPRPSGWSK